MKKHEIKPPTLKKLQYFDNKQQHSQNNLHKWAHNTYRQLQNTTSKWRMVFKIQKYSFANTKLITNSNESFFQRRDFQHFVQVQSTGWVLTNTLRLIYSNFVCNIYVDFHILMPTSSCIGLSLTYPFGRWTNDFSNYFSSSDILTYTCYGFQSFALNGSI